jgi:DNA polymerase/3'-5' exonuclease PolX
MNFNPPRKLKEIENNYEPHLSKEKNRNTLEKILKKIANVKLEDLVMRGGMEKKVNIPPAVPIGISPFLLSFEKGTRKIRKALTELANKPDMENTGDVVIPIIRSTICFWNFTGQENTIRDFLYKFMYNQLGLNTRVSHFVQNQGIALCVN